MTSLGCLRAATIALGALSVASDAAFLPSLRSHDNRPMFASYQRPTAPTRLHAATATATRPKLPGAAKNAKEDLELTRKVIMDFIKSQAKESATKDTKPHETVTPTIEKEEEEEKPSLVDSLEEAAVSVSPTLTESTETETETDADVETATEREETVADTEVIAAEPATVADVEIARDFEFVYDEWKGFQSKSGRASRDSGGSNEERPTIACDTRIPACSLVLSNWNGNADTPADLYADTSTEMALKLATHPQYAKDTQNALVLSNHYDTGGVLSVFACVEPKLAVEKYSSLLVDGAQAGDFHEWSSDKGIKLHCILTEMGKKAYGEGVAFVTQLQDDNLITLLDDMLETGGNQYFNLWNKGFAEATTSYDNLVQEKAKLDFYHDGRVVTITRGWFVPPVSPFALQRYLREQGKYDKVQRILQVLTDARGARYTYQKPGHGWVPEELVDRPTIPTVNAGDLVEQLNAEYEEAQWKIAGLDKDEDEDEDEISRNVGRTDICQSTISIATPVEEVVDFLVKQDSGL